MQINKCTFGCVTVAESLAYQRHFTKFLCCQCYVGSMNLGFFIPRKTSFCPCMLWDNKGNPFWKSTSSLIKRNNLQGLWVKCIIKYILMIAQQYSNTNTYINEKQSYELFVSKRMLRDLFKACILYCLEVNIQLLMIASPWCWSNCNGQMQLKKNQNLKCILDYH